jgi:hypothetical protein
VAIAEDASTPAVATNTGAGTIVTASFSPPANSLLVALVGGGWGSTQPPTASLTDSVAGSWTTAATANPTTGTAGGIAKIFYRYLSSAPGSMTVTASYTNLSGGRFIAVRVINGANSVQTSSGTGTTVHVAASTDATIAVTTTVTGSVVYGITDCPSTNTAFTPNGSTSFLSSGDFNDATDTIEITAWKASSATGSPGSTTLGGTYGTVLLSNIAAFEVVPLAVTTVSPTSAHGTGTVGSTSAVTSSSTPSARTASGSGTAVAATILAPITPAFPITQRDIDVELYLNSTWIDVTSDVRNGSGIDITRGRPNEASNSQPSTCALTFDNRTGNYSPRNPNGIYFGQLGRNSQIRVAVGMATDTFVRTVPNSWGYMDTGQVWTSVSSTTLVPADFQVTGGVGTQSVSAAGGYRYTYTASNGWGDADVSVTFTLPFTTVTGNSVFPGSIILRWVVGPFFYMVQPRIDPSGHVFIGIVYGDGTSLSSFIDTGIIHSSSQALRVRAQIEGNTIRGKIWIAAGNEPFSWQVTTHDQGIGFAGGIGISSATNTGNTNTYPVVVSYSNLKIRSARFFGEIAAWPQQWDITGSDIIAPIEAAGITRRLGQGQSPDQSTLYRGETNQVPAPKAYWPCEDGTDSAFITSGIGGPNMFINTVTSTAVANSATATTKFASYSGFVASAPIPTVGTTTTWAGVVPPYTNTNAATLSFITHLGATTIADSGIIATLVMEGTANRWQIRYRQSVGPPVIVGDLSVTVQQNGGAQLHDSGAIAFAINDQDILIKLSVTQNGTGVDYNIATLQVGQDSAQFVAHTVASCTVKRAVQVVIAELGEAADTPIGHIGVVDYVGGVFDLSTQLKAYAGETVGDRLTRLCAQIGAPLSYVGDSTRTALVGAQHVDTVLNIITEAANTDLGTLTEPRGAPGILYRTRSSIYLQNSGISLNYTGGQVSSPFDPVDDDQLTRNDITVTRRDGTSATAQLLTGRMSILDPALGGVGIYDTSTTINVANDDQLPDVAGWLLNLGTVDLTRYPKVRVNLASPQVVADPILNPGILDLSIDDQFTITAPNVKQSPDSVSLVVRGYTEHISNFEHSITFNAAPNNPYATNVTDIDGVKLDSAGSALAAPATSVATSLSVATTLGPLWTTVGGQMPMRIVVSGEQMTVTAVSGSSSPQTFTVTRSTNGIVKAQASGAAVRLFFPAITPL